MMLTTIALPSTDQEIGPRRPGAIYQNCDGRFEVLALITDPAEATKLLRRASARWAVIVRDTLRPDGQPLAVGSVWTTSDYLVRPAKKAAPSDGFAPAAGRPATVPPPPHQSVKGRGRGRGGPSGQPKGDSPGR